MKNNKIYIVLITIFVAFFIIMYLAFGKEYQHNLNRELDMAVGTDTIWTLREGVFENVNNKDKESYNWTPMNIYLDSKFIGEYKIWLDDKFYLFDKSNNAKLYTESFLGLKSNYNVKVQEYTTEEITDFKYVTKALEMANISSREVSLATKTTIDIDSDGTTEDIYIVSNAFDTSIQDTIAFSLVFMEKDGEIYIMRLEQVENNYVSGSSPYIHSVIDINEDGIYEIILTCEKYGDITESNYLYEFNNKFELIISNE